MAYIQKKRQYRLGLYILIVMLLIVMFFSCSVGAADIDMIDALKIILSRLPIIGEKINMGTLPNSAETIVWKIRLPRVLLAMFSGSALALAGATYQGLFRNPLAEPYILGVSAGAAFGGTVSIVFGLSNILGIGGTSLMAFIGAILTTLIVYNLGKGQGRTSMTHLILAGVAINSLLSSLISLFMILDREKLDRIVLWTMGSFTGASWEKVLLEIAATVIGMVVIYAYGRDLNIILTGEENAKYLGVDVEFVKRRLLIVSSFISAVTVSVSGIIGFVGLIIPHGVRIVVGPDHRALLPYSLVVGGIFLMLADTLARIIMPPVEIPVGVITAIFGAPFFLHLLLKSKREGKI